MKQEGRIRWKFSVNSPIFIRIHPMTKLFCYYTFLLICKYKMLMITFEGFSFVFIYLFIYKFYNNLQIIVNKSKRTENLTRRKLLLFVNYFYWNSIQTEKNKERKLN